MVNEVTSHMEKNHLEKCALRHCLLRKSFTCSLLKGEVVWADMMMKLWYFTFHKGEVKQSCKMQISSCACVVESTEDRADFNMVYKDETFRKGEQKEWVVGCVRGTEAIFSYHQWQFGFPHYCHCLYPWFFSRFLFLTEKKARVNKNNWDLFQVLRNLRQIPA